MRGLPPRLWPYADWLLAHWGWPILFAAAFAIVGGARWALGYRTPWWRRYVIWWLVSVFLLATAIRTH